ncbi:MAG: C4-type zinc ribbon domain-containing protein [Proteobacteria bacterium]|nr:C4-type zinc ribbon domain-containing protein [Pseudomonadota bacterium]
MKDTIAALWGLQKLDLEIIEFDKRLGELPCKKQILLEKIREIEEQGKKKKEELISIEDEKNKLEKEIEEEANKIKTVESRLGFIRNPKEYQEVRKKVELAKKANKLREDEVLKKMEQIEAINRELETLIPKIEEETKKIYENLKIYEEEELKLKDDRDILLSRREVYISKIPDDIYKKYETIRAKSRGIGVSQAKNESCEGCFMNLPPQLYNLILKGDNLYNCPYCQRFLVYIPEPEEETQEE